MKIAILHEMLVKFGGAEKVVESFLKIFPDADLFTLVYDEKKMWWFFPKEKINTQVFSLPSQKRYNWTKKQRVCLPLMPRSIEQLDFSKYDIVLCSSSGFAHWAITKPETKFIVYYHSPARYLWDWTNEYKKDIWFSTGIKWFFLNKLFLKLRQWDIVASSRADISIANSNNTASRITKYYRKESEIIYPGVETERFAKKMKDLPQPLLVKEGGRKVPPLSKGRLGGVFSYYIIISALTEFKKIEVAIDAFNKMSGKKLVIIGQWNFRWELENLVESNNITFIGPQYWDALVSLVQNSSWLVFPGEEDFWIVPIEVMAAGKPVFAYKWWWLTETVLEWTTWEFFENKEWKDFVEKFKIFDKNNWKKKYKKDVCIKQAENFSIEVFEKKIKKLINK